MASKVIIDIIANDKASGVTSGITSTLSKLSTALLAIGTAGAAAFLALGKQALDATTKYESMAFAVETLIAKELRAADSTLTMTDALAKASVQSKELLEWIEDLAIKSPFDSEGIADALRTAQVYGFTTESAKLLTKNLVDLAAATNTGTFEMKNITRALGQMNRRGKVMAEELNQLAEAGAPAYEVLAQMGYTLEDVSRGLVSSEDYLKAFNKTIEDTVGGSAERAMNNWKGLISTIKEFGQKGLRTMFADSLEVLKPFVVEFSNWLQGDGLKKLEEIGAAMGDITQSIVDMFTAMQGMSLPEIVKSISEGATAMTEGFKRWAQGIDWHEISNQIADGIASIDWAGLGEQVRIAAINIFDGIRIAAEETDWAAMFASATTAFLDFIAGLTNQGTWENVQNVWRSNFDQLKTIIDSGLAITKERGVVQAAAIGAAIPAQMAVSLSIGLGGVLQALWAYIPPIINIVQSLKQKFIQEFEQMIQGAIKRLENLTDPLVEAVRELINAAIRALKPINISIGLPDFEALAAEIEAGMALINAALGGTSKGAKGSNVWSGGGQSKKGRAMGGHIGSGQATLVGEHGAEIFVPDTGGKVIPNYRLGMGGGGGNVVVNLTYAPAFSTVDQYELQERLAPFIERGIRSVQRGTA